MTEEKVKKGTELLQRLRSLKEERRIWEGGVTLQRMAISDKWDYISESDIYRVRCAYVDFDKLKEDTLANIDRMIEKTQEEFNKL
jgi:hypothetical protein|nr:MAG TPA: hypothetical protein [Crassvirales sp.]